MPGTDVGSRECINFDCKQTEITCPPEGYEMCPGWPQCEEVTDPDGKQQQWSTQYCNAVPTAGIGMCVVAFVIIVVVVVAVALFPCLALVPSATADQSMRVVVVVFVDAAGSIVASRPRRPTDAARSSRLDQRML